MATVALADILTEALREAEPGILTYQHCDITVSRDTLAIRHAAMGPTQRSSTSDIFRWHATFQVRPRRGVGPELLFSC